MAESEMFNKGLAVRRDVLGTEYVDGSLAKADDFMMAFQRITTEWCWGYAWTRDGLNRRERSMLNLAMLTALEPVGFNVDSRSIEAVDASPPDGAHWRTLVPSHRIEEPA